MYSRQSYNFVEKSPSYLGFFPPALYSAVASGIICKFLCYMQAAAVVHFPLVATSQQRPTRSTDCCQIPETVQ